MTTFHFAVCLSRNSDTEAAARDLADEMAATLPAPAIDLACLFVSSHHYPRISLLTRTLLDALQPRVMIGCSGEGVIAGSKEVETAPAVALWAASLGGQVSIEPLRLTFSRDRDRFALADWPTGSTPDSSLLLFADPFTTPVGEVLSLVDERLPGTPAVGGLAGGGRDAGENRLILQEEICDTGVVGVRLSGPLEIRPLISQGCQPIGERFVVTKAEHNVIHELSGRPALTCLREIFESLEDGARRQAHRALHIGIAIDEHRDRFERGDFLVRNLVGADQATGALAIGDIVQEGQTVQFHLRDGATASEDLNLMLAADRAKHPNAPRGALVFSCCGRGQGLFGRPHHDAETVSQRLGAVPLAGFFAQGEIGPIGGRNFLHGYTASLALFAERRKSPTPG